MKRHNYGVYMIASKSRTLYIGMTNNLTRRIFEHKNRLIDGFSKDYQCHRLVYYELFDDVRKAIDREKQFKRWNRAKKVFLIERGNRTWEDLAASWLRTREGTLHLPVDCCATNQLGRDDKNLEIGRLIPDCHPERSKALLCGVEGPAALP
ncbi:MAG: putative endonuclease [Acidobacteriaceae bacterium]|jgi:putative endonuclease